MLLHKIHDAFKHIMFYEKGHKYIDLRNGRRLKSVTTKLRDYIKPFQRDYWLKVKADQRGISMDELSDEWDAIRDAGIERGNSIHSYAEGVSRRRIMTDETNLAVHAFFTENSHYIPIASELVIGDNLFGGQIDLLAYDRFDVGIIDYKTDKKFEKENKWGNTLLDPFSDMPECEMSKYTMQVNMYRHLFEQQTGIRIGFMKIVWFTKEGGYEIHSVERMNKIKLIWPQ